jgi:shikimate dehydrogenase
MRQFGLIGYPITHSFSENYFKEKFQREHITDASYKLFPLEHLEDFQKLLTDEDPLAGLNVTLPYKTAIVSYLDELDPEAKQVGAVNTIKIVNGKKIGFNTDVYGFEQSLLPLLKDHHTSALILGTGGASKAVVYVLKKLGIAYTFVSSSIVNEVTMTYADVSEAVLKDVSLIIQTTPLGMFPDIDAFPAIPYACLTEQHLCYDLIYNPEESVFLKKASFQGASTKNGLEMLYLQAERSWQIWNTL